MDIKAILENEDATASELGDAKRGILERIHQHKRKLAELVSESEDITLQENNEEAMQDVVARIQTEMALITALENNLGKADQRMTAKMAAANLAEYKYKWQCSVDLMDLRNKQIKKAEELMIKAAEEVVKAHETEIKLTRSLPLGPMRRHYSMYIQPWGKGDPLLKAFVQKFADMTGAAKNFMDCRGIWAFDRRGASTIYDILKNDSGTLEMIRDEHLQLVQRDSGEKSNENG